MLSLENARINSLGVLLFTLSNLEYLYISSTSDYIVGNGSTPGSNLRMALISLPLRKTKTPGQIIVRGIKYDEKLVPDHYIYSPVEFDKTLINNSVTKRNWAIYWDPTFEWDTDN